MFTSIKEGARKIFLHKIKETRKDLIKISVASMAGKLFLFSVMFAFVPLGGIFPQSTYDTAVKLDSANPMAAVLADKTVPVETGESVFDAQEKAQHQATRRQVAYTENTDNSHRDPTELRPLYQAAAAQFGIPWQLIEAVHEVESGKSGSTGKRSYAGATGPMQFMPGTWRSYAVDGDGDGDADITDLTDAIYTGARYLANSGADEGRIDDALFNYNHSAAYVNKVKSIAIEIGL